MPGRIGIGECLEHEPAPDLGRADGEAGVPWAAPSRHLVASVVDAAAVLELDDALGEGDQ